MGFWAPAVFCQTRICFGYGYGLDLANPCCSRVPPYPSVMCCRWSVKWKCVMTKCHVWQYSCSYSQDYRHGEWREKRGRGSTHSGHVDVVQIVKACKLLVGVEPHLVEPRGLWCLQVARAAFGKCQLRNGPEMGVRVMFVSGVLLDICGHGGVQDV